MTGIGGGSGGIGGGRLAPEGIASGRLVAPKLRGVCGVTSLRGESGIPRGGIGNCDFDTMGERSGSLKMRMMVSVDWLERDGLPKLLGWSLESRCCCCRRRYHDQMRRIAMTTRTRPKAETRLAIRGTSRRRGVSDINPADAAVEGDELVV